MIFPHSHKRTCPSTPNAPVRLVYGYRREGEGSRGSWELYMLKKGSGIFVAEEKGVSPHQLLYPLDQRKTGENVLETYKTICYLFLLL